MSDDVLTPEPAQPAQPAPVKDEPLTLDSVSPWQLRNDIDQLQAIERRLARWREEMSEAIEERAVLVTKIVTQLAVFPGLAGERIVAQR